MGKTTHCESLAENTGLKHLSVNDVVKERGCHDGYDEEFGSWIVDEDKVCDFSFFCEGVGRARRGGREGGRREERDIWAEGLAEERKRIYAN